METSRLVHLGCLALYALPAALYAADYSEGERLFALTVKPLIAEKCFACHGKDPKKIKGELRMDSRANLLKGGESSKKVLVPGDARASRMFQAVLRLDEDTAMPPKEKDALTRKQAWAIRDWINAGAPWPDDRTVAAIVDRYAKGRRVTTSGGLSDDWTNRRYEAKNLWAYQPLKKPPPPGETGPVDAFIDRSLHAAGLSAAPRADARSLIRRAAFDLTGLPPAPEEIDAFVRAGAEDRETAWTALIERLLASPHYGEHWGRHWLDVVRYADSSGFANDYERPNAWRYRDYVIRSFNRDKPYDQFIREQLAGDELDPENPEYLIAAGFLRMGPWEQTGMSVAKITRQQFLDDVTDSVGQVFLAHPLQCARCHDHKFDPLPTRDYYAMQAVFATAQFGDVDSAWLPEENRNGMDEDLRYHRMRMDANNRMMSRLNASIRDNERKWFEERKLPWKSRAEAQKAKAPPDQVPPRRIGLTPREYGEERIGRKWQTRFGWETDRYKPVVFSVYSGHTRLQKGQANRQIKPGNPMQGGVLEKTAVLSGGDPFTRGAPVRPGVLSAVPGALDVKLPDGVTGRRSALADWIASPGNSLTARVMANRIWHYHFGRGIAGTPNNFGATGKKPTHPELLDWLAAEFMENGWSVKHLHRVIMHSEAYRRAAAHPDAKALAAKDPSRDLYAVFRPRRLSAEELRDAMLSVSGELSREMGGIPARPDMNLEAALQPRMIMGTFAPSYVPHPKPEQRNRRTIYAQRTRGQRDPFLEAFNQPGSERSCEMRDASTVTPQVFMLFNSEESYDRALALAARVVKETEDGPAAVRRLYRLVYGREPETKEAAMTLAHWRDREKVEQARKPEPRSWPSEVTREAVDENTGKPFVFTEKLHVYDDYVPDLQPHQVDARTRALAGVCLVLLNSNEFVYVY